MTPSSGSDQMEVAGSSENIGTCLPNDSHVQRASNLLFGCFYSLAAVECILFLI
jgi:hypothetical protein